jgi:hypothetical protein
MKDILGCPRAGCASLDSKFSSCLYPNIVSTLSYTPVRASLLYDSHDFMIQMLTSTSLSPRSWSDWRLFIPAMACFFLQSFNTTYNERLHAPRTYLSGIVVYLKYIRVKNSYLSKYDIYTSGTKAHADTISKMPWKPRKRPYKHTLPPHPRHLTAGLTLIRDSCSSAPYGICLDPHTGQPSFLRTRYHVAQIPHSLPLHLVPKQQHMPHLPHRTTLHGFVCVFR